MKGHADKITLALAAFAAAVYVVASVAGELPESSGHPLSWSILPVAEHLLVVSLAGAITVTSLAGGGSGRWQINAEWRRALSKRHSKGNHPVSPDRRRFPEVANEPGFTVATVAAAAGLPH